MNSYHILKKTIHLPVSVRLGCLVLLFGPVLMVPAESNEAWWALQPLEGSTIPKEPSEFSGWGSNPIDRFIAAKRGRSVPAAWSGRKTAGISGLR